MNYDPTPIVQWIVYLCQPYEHFNPNTPISIHSIGGASANSRFKAQHKSRHVDGSTQSQHTAFDPITLLYTSKSLGLHHSFIMPDTLSIISFVSLRLGSGWITFMPHPRLEVYYSISNTRDLILVDLALNWV